MQIKNKNIKSFLIYFLLIHLIVWTAAPSLSNVNLPLDTIEALAWGSSLEWGYFKHPPLSAWFTEIFYQLFGNQDWAYYFLSQIFVISAFFIVFKFSEYFFNNLNYSLISILLLEGIYFYNYTTPEFNVNVCQLPFWALSILYCWKGIENNKNSDWLLFGLFAALGVLSKYLFIYLLISVDIFFLYMIFKKEISFKCLVSIIPFFLVLSPHLIWLVENDYATINYALQRAGGEESVFSNHLFYPVIFLLKQIGILIPFFLMVLFLVSKFKINLNLKNKKLLYLLVVTIVPIILMFLTSIIMGAKIRTMWMTPFYLFFGVLVVYIFQSQIDLKKIKNFILVFIILFIFSPFAYSYISITQTEKRTDYKGKQIANNVQMIWNKKYKSKIKYVKGDEWYAGNLSYHLESRPKWLSADSRKIIKTKDIMLPNEIKIPVRLYGEE